MILCAVTVMLTLLLCAGDTSAANDGGGRAWYVPGHVKTQFAGNMGFLSLGIGCSYFGDACETDLMYGYAHEDRAGIDIHHITVKNTYRPFTWNVSPRYTVAPLTLGLHFAYKIVNNNYETWLFLPKRYPDKYYFPTAFHFLPAVGSSVSMKRTPSSRLKHIDFFYEIGSVDLYIAHYAGQKKVIRFPDILNLALGMAFRF